VIYGDGSKIRDYIYVDDVVEANLAALSRGHGEVFNIASGIPTSDQEVFSRICQLLGSPELRPQYVGKRPGEIDGICLDISKAKQLLGWSPRVTIAEGARQTAHYFQGSALALAR